MRIHVIKKGVALRKEEFGGLVFTNRTPILSLNVDSFRILSAIDGKRTTEQIVELLNAENKDTVYTQEIVESFLTACAKLDLIISE